MASESCVKLRSPVAMLTRRPSPTEHTPSEAKRSGVKETLKNPPSLPSTQKKRVKENRMFQKNEDRRSTNYTKGGLNVRIHNEVAHGFYVELMDGVAAANVGM